MSLLSPRRSAPAAIALLVCVVTVLAPAGVVFSRGAGLPTRSASQARQSPNRLSAAETVLAYPPPPIEARAAYLVDLTSHRVLFSQNANAELPMASTTKITTAAVVLSHARPSEMVKVSEKAATIGQSTMSLQRGERLTVLQLLYGLLLNSGNDAAIALAEHVGGTESRFVGMMNALARSLGMRHTHYATPHGLDAPHHYTSARDLATITMYALQFPLFRQIVATTSYHIPATRHNAEHWLASINRVMYWFPGVDGVKPGDTDAAGLCQVVSAWRNGHHLLAVLLNTPTLVTDIRDLLNYGGHDFKWVQAPAYWDTPANEIRGGRGTGAWLYYLGAGHYIRGLFLRYFVSHGGLRTLGFPRTEAIRLGSERVQYFEGGELVMDARSSTVHAMPLGQQAADWLVPHSIRNGVGITPGFVGAYARFDGRKALGAPVTRTVSLAGNTVQFFRDGAIVEFEGAPALLPVGDLALKMHGWLPASGSADAYPLTIAGPLAEIDISHASER